MPQKSFSFKPGFSPVASELICSETVLTAATYLADRVFAPEEQHVYIPATTPKFRSVRSEMLLVSTLRSDGARVV
jgi:hypothetical protein